MILSPEREQALMSVADKVTEIICRSDLSVSEADVLLLVIHRAFKRTFGDQMQTEVIQHEWKN